MPSSCCSGTVWYQGQNAYFIAKTETSYRVKIEWKRQYPSNSPRTVLDKMLSISIILEFQLRNQDREKRTINECPSTFGELIKNENILIFTLIHFQRTIYKNLKEITELVGVPVGRALLVAFFFPPGNKCLQFFLFKRHFY
jgi:ABC-type iron transport system FetAB ATPase subunit